MWAGSEIAFVRPLKIGVPLRRRSTIGSVVEKEGRSGRLVFVRVDHEVHDHDGLVLTDRHDIVYRDAPVPTGAPPPRQQAAPIEPQWSRLVEPDPVLLFRYSALTFNGHRIHYDRPFAMEQEGYPGLVVHGPLIALAMLAACRDVRPRVHLTDFKFRVQRPAFDGAPITLAGRYRDNGSASLWAVNQDGELLMTGEALTKGEF